MSARYAAFYALPHEIPCNFARRFPLYGVRADGLPLRKSGIGLERALQWKELNIHNNENPAHDTPKRNFTPHDD